MQLRLYDVTMASGNPSSLLGTPGAVPPTGGGPVTVGSATTPFLAGPLIEGIYREVADIGYNPGSGLIPAPAGSLVVQQFIATNTGGAQFQIAPTTGNQQLPRFSYGVVVSPPTLIGGPNGTFVNNVPGGQSLICVEGMAVALNSSSGTPAAGTALAPSNAVRGALYTNPVATTLPGSTVAIQVTVPVVSGFAIVKVGGF